MKIKEIILETTKALAVAALTIGCLEYENYKKEKKEKKKLIEKIKTLLNDKEDVARFNEARKNYGVKTKLCDDLTNLENLKVDELEKIYFVCDKMEEKDLSLSLGSIIVEALGKIKGC